MIKKKEFNKICKAAEFFLRTNYKNLVLLSISEAHVIRPHPIFLKNYQILFEKYFFINISYLFIKNFIKVIYFLFSNNFRKRAIYNFKKNDGYIFVSHFFNQKQIFENKNKDFYFSHFFKYKRKDSSLVLFNHLKKNFNSKNKIILNTHEKFLDEIKLFAKVLREFFLFNKNYEKKKNIFYKKFLILIFSNLCSVNTLNNLRIYYQFKKILKKTKPKKIIVTFEGHVFERNIFLAANSVNDNIEKIGFHHSIPFQNQFSYTLKLNNGSDPDIVMTSGKISTKEFLRLKIYSNIMQVGSNRISNKDKILKKLKINKILTCLVIPEGIESETELLLNFCRDYLKKYEDIKFIIRLHPVLKSKAYKYIKYFDKDTIGIKVFFSNNSRQLDDIKKCDIALYRGTSLIFDAVKNGIVPFYYQKNNELNFDPLSLASQKKNQSIKISNISEFNQKVSNKNIFTKNYYFEAYSYPDKKKILNYFS